jgi:signal transduction histidine kinase
MASLGELTAGIAHEIQNPLNFVNNFSELSLELVAEMKEELTRGDPEEAMAIADDIFGNLEKIHQHGKRADATVKGMLLHSRTGTGTKEPTPVNALADEYLRLSYHGLRAKDKAFNARLVTDFDEHIGEMNLIPQDMGRVFLNLFTNAFYAVNKKRSEGRGEEVSGAYEPEVSVKTKKHGRHVEIRIRDNGTGIPAGIVDKIYQPFFTTKPTGEGTGLGLSLSYDIITKSFGGQLKVDTREGEFTEFIIHLPL